LAAFALLALAAWSILLARRGRWLALVGVTGWLLTLAPVLPLLHARYQHYLYTPLAFLAVALVGAVVPARFESRSAARWAWVAGIAIVLAHAAWSERLVSARHARWIPGIDLPFDSFLRKTEFVRRFDAGLRDLPRTNLHVLVLEPEGVGRTYSVRTGQAVAGDDAPTSYRMVEAALEDGRALRFLHPQIDSVAFADRWERRYDGWILVTHTQGGRSTVHGAGMDAHAAIALRWMRGGLVPQGIAHLERVLEAHPDAAALRDLLTAAQAAQARRAAVPTTTGR
jgi:hypothetical protein